MARATGYREARRSDRCSSTTASPNQRGRVSNPDFSGSYPPDPAEPGRWGSARDGQRGKRSADGRRARGDRDVAARGYGRGSDYDWDRGAGADPGYARGDGSRGDGSPGDNGRGGNARADNSRAGNSRAPGGRNAGSRADQARADQGRADQGRADQGRADQGRADRSWNDPGRADWGAPDQGRADQGRADRSWGGQRRGCQTGG